MTDGDSFLRAIGLAPSDDLPRLVYADWLEERGEVARAEFIRVQCELVNPLSAEDRLGALRPCERRLLDAYRSDWIAELGVPVEAVLFRRGLISGMRFSDWDRGQCLGEALAPRLTALEELDLSGLGIGDAGIKEFARRAAFPALRKIHLNGNGITDAGALALASAEGIPNLTAVYLFDNPVGAAGRVALDRSTRFRLTDLDLGAPATGYLFTPGQADAARRKYLRVHLLPFAAECFAKYVHLQSAMLCVAQYWADEADDAVHAYLIVSELPEPGLEGAHGEFNGDENIPDPNVPRTHIVQEHGDGGSAMDLYGHHWDSNNAAIPLWAAYAPEGANQEYESISEAYAPAVMFYRHGGYEILPMLRPQLDGILPEWH